MSFNAPSFFFTEFFTLSGFEQIRHVIEFDLLVDQLEVKNKVFSYSWSFMRFKIGHSYILNISLRLLKLLKRSKIFWYISNQPFVTNFPILSGLGLLPLSYDEIQGNLKYSLQANAFWVESCLQNEVYDTDFTSLSFATR